MAHTQTHFACAASASTLTARVAPPQALTISQSSHVGGPVDTADATYPDAHASHAAPVYPGAHVHLHGAAPPLDVALTARPLQALAEVQAMHCAPAYPTAQSAHFGPAKPWRHEHVQTPAVGFDETDSALAEQSAATQARQFGYPTYPTAHMSQLGKLPNPTWHASHDSPAAQLQQSGSSQFDTHEHTQRAPSVLTTADRAFPQHAAPTEHTAQVGYP